MENASTDGVNGPENDENIENNNDTLQENQFNDQLGIPLTGEAEEEAEELVVLHPDHSEELKREKAEHLELGSTLYNAQQELSRFQGQLEQKHEEGMVMQAKREEMDLQLLQLRKTYKESQQEYDREYKKMMTLREEVDNLCLRLYYLNNARDEVKKDIIIMKRAAEKAVTDLTKIILSVFVLMFHELDHLLYVAKRSLLTGDFYPPGKMEDEKRHQDMLANRLQITIDQLTEDCELLEQQLIAQESDLRGGENLLHEMDAQIMGIRADRKRLMAHWNSSLIGLQRRNEAYTALMKEFEKKKDELTNVLAETEGVKRNISEEQEAHEKLTITVRRTEKEISTMKSQLEKMQNRHEILRQEYAENLRMLQESERNLLLANHEKSNREHELNALRKKMEQQYLVKHEFEDKIEEELRSRLTAKKAVEYVKKMSKNLHDQSREFESQVATLENNLANDSLAVAKTKAESTKLHETLKKLEEDILQRNDLVNKLETEIHHSNILVQRQQAKIDTLNKKLEQLLRDRGGVELGPLEIMLNHLTKGIAAKNDEIGSLEQQWLKEQTDLVKHVKEKERLLEVLSRQQCQLTILAKKKLRLDADINSLEREKAQMNRDMTRLQNSMARINKMIFVKKSSGTALEQENKLAEEDFVRALREKEQETVEMQSKLDAVIKEKEELLSELIETERHIMLWEKKVQLVNETKQAVDSSVGQGEIKAMESEIHRMELRKAQIARQQEMLIQALEKSVASAFLLKIRRDIIITRTEGMKGRKPKGTTKEVILRELDELRRKITTAGKTVADYTAESANLEVEAEGLEKSLKEKNRICEAARNRSLELTKKLQALAEDRQKGLIELQMRQHATRYWEQLSAGRYRRLCPTAQAAKSERERQLGRMRSMLAVVDRLTSDFPAVCVINLAT
ncbi:unnamed protein product [Schistocephalus solidus]|uniref:Coiled-coil domain-containing protein 40 n=1 Tax=Schistocephalus solidus TaxID=70667 RepID=A0A183SQ84_SCHSO|nr:unnamed protein product [Schistocephalus solidus]